MKITAVIVTFNRKTDFLRCLQSVLNQTQKLDDVVIVNNASTDGTYEELCKYFSVTDIEKIIDKTYLLSKKDGINIHIINMPNNLGGSGGFHTGLKIANEELHSDYFWLMDDDGYPSENCLEMLLSKASLYDYIMPTSIDILNHDNLSWPTRKINGKKTARYDELKESWGEIMNYVTPFNGILLSKKCVTDVGYINKDFFLWGDEYDHYWRCKQKGFEPVTLLDARFFHPAQKMALVKICFGLFSVPFVESPLRMICLARNYTYIYRHYNQKWKILVKWLMYWWLFIITRHGDFAGWKLYKSSVKDGFKEDFTRHLQYLKK